MDHLSTQNPRKKRFRKEVYRGLGHNRRTLLLLLVSMVIFLAYCSPPLTHRLAMVANRPEKKVYKVKPDVLREAIERVLEKKKFTLDTKQSNNLHLKTEWLEDRPYRSMVVADIKPLSRGKTELTLKMYLEKKLLFRNKWKPTDEIEENIYRQLLSDIEMECYRVLYDRT